MYGEENRSIHIVWPGSNFESFLFLYKKYCKYSNITTMRCPTLLSYSEISMRAMCGGATENLQLFESSFAPCKGGKGDIYSAHRVLQLKQHEASGPCEGVVRR